MSSVTYANIYSAGSGDPSVGRAFEDALASLRQNESPIECEHHIGGIRLRGGEQFVRRDPVDPNRVVSQAFAADSSVIDRAVAVAREVQPAWRQMSSSGRTQILRELAPRFEDRAIELAALVSYETGKTRADAIAEVNECIKIVELSVSQFDVGDGFVVPHRAPSEGSEATVVLRPYGVFGVIAPFNFPLAIPLGMTFAALLMGDAVVFKPSGITPACGDAFASLFEEIGLPAGVLNTVHGEAETGRTLVEADIDGLAFTGSAEVGLTIARRLNAEPFVRPLVAEMGGKNPAIVTESAADLGMAARAVARSAFGMSGQKCNACSRAIVLDGVYDQFVEDLVGMTEELDVGDPIESDRFTGPVISEAARERYDRAVALARRDGSVLCGGRSWGDGHFVACTVVDELPAGHELTREEQFLPLLAVTRVSTLGEAITEGNSVRYGLSAGIISGNPAECDRFLDEIEAGIVFVNNPGGATTGVWPGSQTMSGWKASGTSGKGGFGPWYLQQFGREQSRTIFGRERAYVDTGS